MTGLVLTLLNARGLQSSGDEDVHREQDDQHRHRDREPVKRLTNTAIITDDLLQK
jgi:hypothetical protein